MARKRGRDLFEILGARAYGERVSPARRRAAAESGFGGVLGWIQGFLPAAPVRSGRRSGAAPRWSGLLVTALAFVAFGVGFAVGRGTSTGDRVDAGRLRIDGAAPEWLGEERTPAARTLTRAEEEEALSTFGFVPVWYPAPQRQQAARVAGWLRDQGLESARLRPMKDSRTNELYYFVVCYTDDRSGAHERAILTALEAPDFAPELEPGLRKLPQTPKTF